MKIEHTEVRSGDVVELADEPAEVRNVYPWLGGYVRLEIVRPAGASLPGACGWYEVREPLELVSRAVA